MLGLHRNKGVHGAQAAQTGEMPSRKVSGYTRLSKMDKVSAKIATPNQNKAPTCGNGMFAGTHSTHLSIADGLQSMGNTQTMVRCHSCVYNDKQQHKHEQAKAFAMVTKQDSTNTTRLTTSDQHEAESAAMQPTVTVQI